LNPPNHPLGTPLLLVRKSFTDGELIKSLLIVAVKEIQRM